MHVSENGNRGCRRHRRGPSLPPPPLLLPPPPIAPLQRRRLELGPRTRLGRRRAARPPRLAQLAVGRDRGGAVAPVPRRGGVKARRVEGRLVVRARRQPLDDGLDVVERGRLIKSLMADNYLIS